MIRLLVADDHAMVREGLVALLGASGDCQVVAEASDGISAIEQAHATNPQIAIIDISMPRLNGLEVVRRLTHELPRLRVLVLTMHEEDEYVLQMVRLGAAGYLVKQDAMAQLLNAVRALAAGSVYFGAYASKVLADQLQQPRKSIEDPYGGLSSREREVMHLVVDGLTTKEIARKLEISAKTAENHRGRILSKLGLRNTAELVRYAMHRGLAD